MKVIRRLVVLAICVGSLSGCTKDPSPTPQGKTARSATPDVEPEDPRPSGVVGDGGVSTDGVISADTQEAPDTVVYQKRNAGRFRESRFFRAHDMFLAANAPQTVAADEATFLSDDDEVLGFVIEDEPRAYSVRMLAYHHVVNDTIKETPITVTY
jgi:hypothetical protein